MAKPIEEILARDITKKIVALAIEARNFSLDTLVTSQGEVSLRDIKTKESVFKCTSYQELQAFILGIKYGLENEEKLRYDGLL